MKIISICKPDLLVKDHLLNEYFNRLMAFQNISDIEIYNLSNWPLNSLYLYEFDCNGLTEEEEKKKRHELLVTAKGYDELYNDKNAFAILMNMNATSNSFKELKDFKKNFRREFVYGGEASYIRFINEHEIDYLSKFDKDSLLKIKAIIQTYPQELKERPELFYMIYFNMIHFPVTPEENEYEYLFLKQGVINENNLVRRLKK